MASHSLTESTLSKSLSKSTNKGNNTSVISTASMKRPPEQPEEQIAIDNISDIFPPTDGQMEGGLLLDDMISDVTLGSFQDKI